MFETEDFLKFVSQDFTSRDREEYLRSFFSRNNIQTSVIKSGPNGSYHHILVDFSQTSLNSDQVKTPLIIAHYDRVENTPGANDNSAAVWTIASWIVENVKSNFLKQKNVRFIFTDGEENSFSGVTDQGAFSLAEIFVKMKLASSTEVFVFDCCGRGTFPVISKAGLSVIQKNGSDSNFSKQFSNLFNRIQTVMIESAQFSNINTNGFEILPVPFSDNAGFLANAIPAVLVTFLPEDEFFLFKENLSKYPELSDMILNSHDGELDKKIFAGKTEKKDLIPFTWRLFHTKNDTPSKLTEESAVLLKKIISKILL